MTTSTNMASTTTKTLPKDAQVIQAILKDQGVNHYDQRLVNQMLEFTYRYVTDVLDDAKVYASHASKKTIDAEDVRVAVQCRMDHTFTNPPPRDLLLDMARQKNQQVLPLIKRFGGTKLPPDRHCLCSTNFKLKATKKHRLQITSQGLSSARQNSIPGVPKMRTISSNKMSIMPRTVVRQNSTSSTPVPSFQMRSSPAGLIRTNTISASTMVQPAAKSSIEVSVKRKREEDDYDNL